MPSAKIKKYLEDKIANEVVEDLKKYKGWNGFFKQLDITGGGAKGSAKKHMMEYIENNNIVIEWKKFGYEKYDVEDYLQNKKTIKSNRLKIKLIQAGMKEDKCESCGIGPIYNNKPLVLQLDHINGNHSDNSISNVRILCPNCHSQTPTFCGKDRKVKFTEEELIEIRKEVEKDGLSCVAIKYNLSRHLIGSRLKLPSYA
jgi:hypothetical protein